MQMKTRVFIVEDQTIVAHDLSHQLERNGFEVIGIASSGHQAISEIKSALPDLILMDVRIQGELNGIEVAIILQSHFESRVPIVFLTGFQESTFAYLKIVNDYIFVNKPFTEDMLLNAISRALEKSTPSINTESSNSLYLDQEFNPE
jgi:two-component SAPR family response regulator